MGCARVRRSFAPEAPLCTSRTLRFFPCALRPFAEARDALFCRSARRAPSRFAPLCRRSARRAPLGQERFFAVRAYLQKRVRGPFTEEARGALPFQKPPRRSDEEERLCKGALRARARPPAREQALPVRPAARDPLARAHTLTLTHARTRTHTYVRAQILARSLTHTHTRTHANARNPRARSATHRARPAPRRPVFYRYSRSSCCYYGGVGGGAAGIIPL